MRALRVDMGCAECAGVACELEPAGSHDLVSLPRSSFLIHFRVTLR